MTRYKIIANPNAGHGKGAHAIPEIERELTRLRLDFDLVRTERVGHAIQLARQAALEGCEVVVAAGGDGTVNEVLNGLMEAREESKNRPALGVLCTGRGNDFAPCINIPEDLAAAFQVLKDDHRRMIDIGRVFGGNFPQGRYFANNVGVGFDAIGTIEVAKLPEWGMLSFLIAILKTIFLFYKGPTVRLDYDDQTLTTSTLMLLTMNGKRMGTGFKMAPEAKPDDGLFDLVIVRQVSRLRIFSLIPHFMKGTQGSQPEVKTLRAARVSIQAVEGALPAQSDGEIICVDGARLDIDLLPRQMEVVCPKE
ncbi:MAG: diacylglycerol kinase family protein [Anaerolineales bacterium]|jgi:YegS/Rv2252/BmrU family lipid kinase